MPDARPQPSAWVTFLAHLMFVLAAFALILASVVYKPEHFRTRSS